MPPGCHWLFFVHRLAIFLFARRSILFSPTKLAHLGPSSARLLSPLLLASGAEIDSFDLLPDLAISNHCAARASLCPPYVAWSRVRLGICLCPSSLTSSPLQTRIVVAFVSEHPMRAWKTFVEPQVCGVLRALRGHAPRAVPFSQFHRLLHRTTDLR